MLLLCLNIKKSKHSYVDKKKFFKYVPAYLVLADLFFHNKIEIRFGKKYDKFIAPIDCTPCGDAIMDEVLGLICSHRGKKRKPYRKIKDWIENITKQKKNLQTRMWRELESDGIIENKYGNRILLKPEIRDKLVNKIRDTVINKKNPDEYMKEIIAFLGVVVGWKNLFNKSEWDQEWWSETVKNQWIITSLSAILAFERFDEDIRRLSHVQPF